MAVRSWDLFSQLQSLAFYLTDVKLPLLKMTMKPSLQSKLYYKYLMRREISFAITDSITQYYVILVLLKYGGKQQCNYNMLLFYTRILNQHTSRKCANVMV